MLLFSTLLLSLFITITLIPVTRKLAIRLHGMDIPNERKVHPLSYAEKWWHCHGSGDVCACAVVGNR
jgi:hypothetical protein